MRTVLATGNKKHEHRPTSVHREILFLSAEIPGRSGGSRLVFSFVTLPPIQERDPFRLFREVTAQILAATGRTEKGRGGVQFAGLKMRVVKGTRDYGSPSDDARNDARACFLTRTRRVRVRGVHVIFNTHRQIPYWWIARIHTLVLNPSILLAACRW